MKHKSFLVAFMVFVSILSLPFNVSAIQQLSIGESVNVYLNPSMPSGAWITTASWSTNVIGLTYSNEGEWGAMITANGYWEDTATVSCLYTYSYYGMDDKIHVSHGEEYYYFKCKGYPITLTPTSLTMDPGDTSKLNFSISGASIGQIPARWVSSNEKVAKVYSSGTYSATVKAEEPGNCVITCYSYMGEPVTCSVKVNSAEPSFFELNPSEATITVDKTVSLRCVFTPTYASSSVTWKSQNSSIATVSSGGTVTGVKAGKTTITATTANGLTAQCAITVTDKFVNPRGPVSKSLEGTGTSYNPYKIKSAADLRYLADKVNSGTDFNGKYFVQTSDIVVNNADYNSEIFSSGEIWIPIGVEGKPFSGNYDGGNHEISGIFITDENDLSEINSLESVGLFGYIGINTTICNVVLTNSLYDFTNNNGKIKRLSGLVGCVYGGFSVNSESTNNSIIINCHIKNSQIKGNDISAISGIGGSSYAYTEGITIDKCSNGADIYGYSFSRVAGIFCGYKDGPKMISNCINAGNIIVSHICRGAAGICMEPQSADLFNCCNMGNIMEVHDTSYNNTCAISGIAIYVMYGGSNTIEHCVNYGDLKGKHAGAILYDGGRYREAKNLINNFYEHSTPLYYIVSNAKEPILQNNQQVTKQQLSSNEILELLNSNLKSGWCRWVRGTDGFPTLDYYPYIAGINDVYVDDSYNNADFALPCEVYNINGIKIAGSTDNLAPGIYFVLKGSNVKKIIVN